MQLDLTDFKKIYAGDCRVCVLDDLGAFDELPYKWVSKTVWKMYQSKNNYYLEDVEIWWEKPYDDTAIFKFELRLDNERRKFETKIEITNDIQLHLLEEIESEYEQRQREEETEAFRVCCEENLTMDGRPVPEELEDLIVSFI